MATDKPLRADARKNRDALIRVARQHLSSRGVTTSLEAIAQEAGVGVGTLYRHFPDRDQLLVAALKAQGAELHETAGRIRATESGPDRLEAWLLEVERHLSTYQGLPDSLARALCHGDDTALGITCQDIIAVTDDFLAEAQQAKTARAGVTGQDLFAAALMTAWLGTQVPERASRVEGVRSLLRHGYRV